MQTLIKNNKGVTVAAALITVLLLGALAIGVIYFVAANQELRIQQVTGDQSFYTVQAGMEFSLAQIIEEGNGDASMTRDFSGEAINITRAGGEIVIGASEGDAYAEHSITDPNPP